MNKYERVGGTALWDGDEMASLREILRLYEVGFRHSPRHFKGNSFKVESDGVRLVVVGTVKPHIKKRYRVVGVIKRGRTYKRA